MVLDLMSYDCFEIIFGKIVVVGILDNEQDLIYEDNFTENYNIIIFHYDNKI